jgi:hypothetical protein
MAAMTIFDLETLILYSNCPTPPGGDIHSILKSFVSNFVDHAHH